ncbi:MAG: GldG family protein [Verrucomicrobiota bacterium]
MSDLLNALQEKLGKSRFEGLLSTTGILIVLGIVLLINVIAQALPIRNDLTEYKLYTLSQGTKQILRELDTPVKIRFFATDGRDAMTADERRFVQTVRDRLLEFKKIGGRNIIFEQLNPEPDTNARDSAESFGLQPMLGQLGEIYLGIVISCIEKTEMIPALNPQREELLEYDLINAISRVYRDERPTVTIMSSINLAGGFSGNFQAPPAEPWFLYSQLSGDFEVEVIPPTTEKIEDTDVLVVLHPYDIAEVGEYAIDQYLLAGGTVVAVVDPLFYSARFMTPPQQQNPMMGGMPPQGGPAPSSDLPTLFEAWGISYQSSQVMADTFYQTDIEPPRGSYLPTLLSLTSDAMNQKVVATSQLTDVYMPFAGGIQIDEETKPDGATLDSLIKASPSNQLVASFEAEPQSADRIRDEFSPTGEDNWHYAIRLTGSFATAFPGGNPNASEEEEAAEEDGDADAADDASEGESDSLAESSKEGTVVVISDADAFYDRFAVQLINFGGMRAAQPINQNLGFAQNLVDVLAGDPRLISVRSRQSTRRPFTLLNRMDEDAQRKMRGRIQQLEQQEQELMDKLQAAMKIQENESGGQEIIIDQSTLDSGEIKALEDERKAVSDDLRKARKDLKREKESFIFQLKVWNILFMPIVVLAIGIVVAVRRREALAAR